MVRTLPCRWLESYTVTAKSLPLRRNALEIGRYSSSGVSQLHVVLILFSCSNVSRYNDYMFLYASAVPNGRARFATAASPLEPQSFKSLRRGYRTGTKERKCHGFDEEVSLPTFLCKNRKVTPFSQPEGRHFEFPRNHFHFPFVFQLRTFWTKLSAASSRPFRV